MIGRVFDNRYEISSKLGTGGMAEVYLAHDRHLGRDVALKVLLSKYATDPEFIERFRREASAAAGLNHPNIVQIYDRGEAEGTYYISMEYLSGRPLKEIIQRYAPLRADHIVSIGTQILEALRFAHRKDVIHRDIKPQNIIVDDEGRVKVTDFGIARAGNATTLTQTGSILGTAHYLSPEQAQGEPSVAASDLYSLGIVLYEMATGRLPFNGDNPVAIAMQHVHEPPPPPSELAAGLPEGLENIILRALAKSPGDRYASAQAFLDDLTKFQQGREIPLPPAFTEQPTRMMAGQQQATPLQATQIRRGTEPRTVPVQSPMSGPPRRRRGLGWLLAIIILLLAAGGAYAAVSLLGANDDRVQVPSLLNMTLAEAQQEGEALGLHVVEGGPAEVSAKYDKDKVMRQDPEKGDRVTVGTTIQIWLSAGNQPSGVPDVVGAIEEEARATLQGFGFQVEAKQEPSMDMETGMVTRQYPAAGQPLAAGSLVVIYVSSGPPAGQVEVPDVVGMTQERAITTLTEAKLVAQIQLTPADVAKGLVAAQSPRAGLKIGEGSFVTIEVSTGPVIKKVRVPGVVGMTREQAISNLAAAGLKAEVTEQVVAGQEVGRVYSQNPRANQEVDEGSTVRIVVVKEAPTTTEATTTTTEPTTTEPTTTTSVTEPQG